MIEPRSALKQWAGAAAAVLLSMGLWAAGPAGSRELRPGIVGTDDRVRAPAGTTWTAVGQVNVGGYRRAGQCTGTLVAPGLVVTAAHCLMDPVTRRPRPLKDIHFLAGVDGAAHKGHAKARCLRFPDGYTYEPPSRSGGITLAALQRDVAVIVLDREPGVPPIPVADDTEPPAPDTALTHAAYPADRRYALTLHQDCRRLPPAGEAPLWSTTCDTHPASSGGPLVIETPEGPRLVAVMVGVGAGRSFALPSTAWRPLTRVNDCSK